MISDYFRAVELRLERAEIITDKSIDLREFDAQEGMLRGRLLFVDGSVLEFMEYLHGDRRLKYRFHLMDKQGTIVFRYDDAPHHDVSSFPHHKHLADRVVESKEKGLLDILNEVEILISKSSN